MKKVLGLFAVTILTVFALTGCNSSDSATGGGGRRNDPHGLNGRWERDI